MALFVAALAAAFGGALVAYLLNAEQAAGAAPLHALPTASVAAAAVVLPVPPLATTPPAAATPAAPTPAWLKPAAHQIPALTLAELQELHATLAATPDPSGEFTQLTEQVLLADATQRFLQLRASGSADAAELNGLAQLITPALDAQLLRGDLTLADARALKWQLLQAQYPQPAMQQAELARWLAALPAR